MKAPSREKGFSRWYPLPEGGELPSVTTLLDVIASHALTAWAERNGTAKLLVLDGIVKDRVVEAAYDEIRKCSEEAWKLDCVAKGKDPTAFWKKGKEIGQEAADFGTLAHAWIEAFLHGKPPSIESLPGPSQKAVQAFLAWEKEHKLEVIKTEQTVYNRQLGYAGTADIICRLDGELCIGDWKTSSGIWDKQPIQIWSYCLAAEMTDADHLFKQIFVGRFGKDGSSEVRIFKRNDFPGIEDARRIIMACRDIFNYLEGWKKAFPYQGKKTDSKKQMTKQEVKA